MDTDESSSRPNSSPGISRGGINLLPILTGYEGKWVALRRDYSEVVASGDNHTECRDAVVARGIELDSVGFMRVPPKGVKLLYRLRKS